MARSSIEAEFKVMTYGICELLWLKALLKELGFGFGNPMKLFYDNKVTIRIAHNSIQHDRINMSK